MKTDQFPHPKKKHLTYFCSPPFPQYFIQKHNFFDKNNINQIYS